MISEVALAAQLLLLNTSGVAYTVALGLMLGTAVRVGNLLGSMNPYGASVASKAALSLSFSTLSPAPHAACAARSSISLTSRSSYSHRGRDRIDHLLYAPVHCAVVLARSSRDRALRLGRSAAVDLPSDRLGAVGRWRSAAWLWTAGDLSRREPHRLLRDQPASGPGCHLHAGLGSARPMGRYSTLAHAQARTCS